MTEWVNSFVIVEKKAPADFNTEDHSSQKKLRIYLDPRDLNVALEWEPYYTRSIKEILGKFHGMTQFMITDFNKGFWMVELHPESRKLTDHGTRHWKVPVDQTSNGFHHGTGCFPVKTWCIFPQHARSNWDSRWHRSSLEKQTRIMMEIS